MDLKEFVRDALIDICEGVAEAKAAKPGRAIINPMLRIISVPTANGGTTLDVDPDVLKEAGLLATNYHQQFADIFEFDLAVTVDTSSSGETEESKKGGGGLKIHVVSAGIEATTKTTDKIGETTSRVSRIKFRVPVQMQST